MGCDFASAMLLAKQELRGEWNDSAHSAARYMQVASDGPSDSR